MSYKSWFILTSLFSFTLMACSDVGSSLSQPSSSEEGSLISSESIIESSSSESSGSSVESSSSTVPLTNEQKLALDLSLLTVTPGTPLRLFGENGSSITWVSSHPHIMSARGAFVHLPYGADPVELTLSATARLGGLSQTRDIVVTVEPPTEVILSRRVDLPFINTSEEYLVMDVPQVPVFYTETGSVPYIDIEDFFAMIDGAVDFSLLNFNKSGHLFDISYSFEDEDNDGNPITFSYEANLDFNLNTLTVGSFSFFGNYVQATETNFSDGLIFIGGVGFTPSPVTIDLGDYRVDLVQHQGKYLMPIAVMNLLFLHSIYYDVYYNGDALYGFDTFTALDAESTTLTQMRTSSLNSEVMPADVRQSTYHFLALAFDYFYGLRPDKNIETFYDVLPLYMNNLLLGNDRNLYSELFRFIYALDDLHSWHEAPGFYEPPSYALPLTSLGQLGPGSQAFYQGSWAMRDLIEARYGAGNLPPSLRLLDNETIAVIFFRNFRVETPDLVKDILDSLPETVESVIIDLAYNTGGNVGAVFRLFGYMTDEPFEYHRINPGDNSRSTFTLSSEYVAYDFDWYISTSSVTFSAANLMTSMAQEMGLATIIGGKTSGGAAAIGMFVTPDGTLLMRSTNGVFARRYTDDNGDIVYESIERGVIPDFPLANPYNDAAVSDLINQIRSSRA